MPCDCRKDIEAKLVEAFLKKAPEASGHTVNLQGYGLVITDGGVYSIPYMEAKAEADYPLKKGVSKRKTIRQNMFFSYCPFCGEKAKTSKEAA